MSSVATTVLHSSHTAPFPIISFTKTCHKCGADLSHSHPPVAEDAQRRISELETQVKILTGKATAAGTFLFSPLSLHSPPTHTYCFLNMNMASSTLSSNSGGFRMLINSAPVDKLADYEDELRELKSSKPPTSIDPNLTAHPPSRPTSAAGVQRNHLQSRISHLLPSSRRATSQPPSSGTLDNQPNPTHNNNNNNRENAELLTMLTREQSLRQAAESRISETNEELEELSAQLFTEANEMVATERKARARLEERVAVLERRDREKRGRLEVLEGRLGRIERVRELLK